MVDYFDALMAERPYHKAMSFEAAIGLLRQEAGKALDPTVVATFIQHLPALQAEAARLEQSMRKPLPAAEPTVGQPATAYAGTGQEERLRRHRARAPRNLRTAEIAQAMGTSLGVSDTMALISAKLSNPCRSRARRCSSSTKRRRRCAAACDRH